MTNNFSLTLLLLFPLASTNSQASEFFYKVFFECWDDGSYSPYSPYISSYFINERVTNYVSFPTRTGENPVSVNCKSCGKACAGFYPGNSESLIENYVTFKGQLGEGGVHPISIRINCKTCDKVCININPSNSESRIEQVAMASRLNITRYRAAEGDNNGAPLTWKARSSHGTPDFMEIRRNGGSRFCWDQNWPDNFWLLRSDHCADGEVGLFYKTIVRFRDPDDKLHLFHLVPWF